MKKIKTFAFVALAFVCAFLVACGPSNGRNVNTPAISMTRYFQDSVTSINRLPGYSERTTVLHLPSFVEEKPDQSTMMRHTSLTFSGDKDWMPGMYIECVYFYVYAGTDLTEAQLSFVMSGLDGGVYDIISETHKVEQPSIGITTKANTAQLVRVDIGHKATSKTLSVKFNFNPSNVDFDWTIYGFAVYGETR